MLLTDRTHKVLFTHKYIITSLYILKLVRTLLFSITQPPVVSIIPKLSQLVYVVEVILFYML